MNARQLAEIVRTWLRANVRHPTRDDVHIVLRHKAEEYHLPRETLQAARVILAESYHL